MPHLDVPDLVRQRALSGGASGRRWLDGLADVVAGLAERWELQLAEPFEGGTAAFVVAAVERSGQPCVLKVAMPLDSDEGDAFARSVLVHRLADGRGCAELLRQDEAVRAMLLERLGPNLHDAGRTIPEILEAIATTLRSFWRPAPGGAALPTGAAKAAWLRRYITTSWVELGRPCPRSVVDQAVAFCDVRAAAFDPSTAVMVHGDAHGWNTLESGDGGCKFVDAEGLWSEPAHDLGVPMREYNEPLLAGDTRRLLRERAERLAAWCDVDPEPVWQWGFIERVSTGLANLRHFDGDGGRAFLAVAERCVDAGA